MRGLVYLVRHGDAGDRSSWVGNDAERPLDAVGREQAEVLVELLAGRELSRILTSPFLRCVQTVEPLAVARRLPVEHRPELAEGALRNDVLDLLDEAGPEAQVVLCTHGDVVEALIGRESEKGSTWVLERREDELVPSEYLPAGAA